MSGFIFGKLLKDRHQSSLNAACGISVLFIGIAGAMQGMLAMDYLSLIGSILIFCVGLNLVWGKKVRGANMRPAVVLAAAAAFIPL